MEPKGLDRARTTSPRRRRAAACACLHHVSLLSLLTIGVAVPLIAQNTPAIEAFGANYSSLRPEQKRLIDDWFSRFSAIVKKPVDPAQAYEKLPLSAKTTFAAVTHALMMTPLTDESGKVLVGSAIELVDKIDGAAGEVLGARGDEQFRIYVQMKPEAMKFLSGSKEFERTADNTVYHKGYPTCFRTKGVPSIQISLTRDAARADIDVDYRSSKFPVALLNGHLTASNSDVREGNNDERHNNQWAGLQNWWRNLLGLPLLETPQFKLGDRVLAKEPKKKDVKPAEAVFDFLNGWLVEQKPNESIAYVSDEAFPCLELRKQPNADRGMAKFLIIQNMIAANQRIGKVASLAEVSAAVPVTGARIKPVDQPYKAEFALYDVREDLAEHFNCANQLDSAQISAKAARSEDFGKYIGALFRVHTKGQTGNVVATLWRKDRGYWKMISYVIDPEIDRSSIPSAAGRATAPTLESIEGDKDMIRASSDFLKLWLLKKDIDKALQYLDRECLACVSAYRADDIPATLTPEDAQKLLRDGLAKAAAAVGSVKNLEEAIVAPDLSHHDTKLVKHDHARAFVIASIPEYMGEAAKCDRRNPEGNPEFRSGVATGYGKYYAIGFSLNQGKTNPATLWINWSRVNDAWKAVSYVIITP